MKVTFLQVLTVIVVSVLVFGVAVSFGFVQYDDPAYIFENGILTRRV